MPDENSNNQINTSAVPPDPVVPPVVAENTTPPPPVVPDYNPPLPREDTTTDTPQTLRAPVPKEAENTEAKDEKPQEVISNISADIPPVVQTGKDAKGGRGFLGGFSNKKIMIPTILGLFILIGGMAAGIYLTQQQQDIREKAWYYSQDPAIGTQCPSFGGHSSQEIGTFQGQCLINYCPSGFGNACSAGVTPGAWSEVKPCSEITSLEAKNYCVQVDYLGASGLYCNIAPPGCDRSQPGGCGAKELSQLDLNGNGVVNEAADCVNTPTGPTPSPSPSITPSPSPSASPGVSPTPTPGETSLQCLNVQAYTLDGTVTDPNSWVLLTSSDYGSLRPGQDVYFVVTANSNPASAIDKARFIINNGTPQDGIVKDACNQSTSCDISFYYKYTITADVSDFVVKAQLHNSLNDTWF